MIILTLREKYIFCYPMCFNIYYYYCTFAVLGITVVVVVVVVVVVELPTFLYPLKRESENSLGIYDFFIFCW